MLHFEKKHSEKFQDVSRVGTFFIAPATLRKVFGEPTCDIPSGDGKVDCTYEFVTKGGAGEWWYKVYAFKATSLYHNSEPTPAEFWAQTEVFPFSIAGEVDSTSFLEWARAQVMVGRKVRNWRGEEGEVVRWEPLGSGMCDVLVKGENGEEVWHASHCLRPLDSGRPLPLRREAREEARRRAAASLQTIRAQHVRDFYSERWTGCEHGKALVGQMLDGAIHQMKK